MEIKTTSRWANAGCGPGSLGSGAWSGRCRVLWALSPPRSPRPPSPIQGGGGMVLVRVRTLDARRKLTFKGGGRWAPFRAATTSNTITIVTDGFLGVAGLDHHHPWPPFGFAHYRSGGRKDAVYLILLQLMDPGRRRCRAQFRHHPCLKLLRITGPSAIWAFPYFGVRLWGPSLVAPRAFPGGPRGPGGPGATWGWALGGLGPKGIWRQGFAPLGGFGGSPGIGWEGSLGGFGPKRGRPALKGGGERTPTGGTRGGVLHARSTPLLGGVRSSINGGKGPPREKRPSWEERPGGK